MKLFKNVFISSLLIFCLLSVPTEGIADSNVELIGVKGDYVEFHGTINKVNKKENGFSILVETDEEGFYDEKYVKREFLIFDDTTLVSEKTMDFVHKDVLKKGMNVTVYCDKNINIAADYSDILWSSVVVIEDSKGVANAKLLKLSEDRGEVSSVEDLINQKLILDDFSESIKNLRISNKTLDGMTTIILSNETIIVDTEGNILDVKDINDEYAVFFYNTVIFSESAIERPQITPKKAIVLLKNDVEIKDKYKLIDKLKVTDRVIINGKKVKLNKPIYRTKNGVVMVPIRQIAEKIDYDLVWIGKTEAKNMAMEVMNFDHYLGLDIGSDDCYYDLVWNVKLVTVPELKNSCTYVSLDVLELMEVKLGLTKDGVLKIDYTHPRRITN